jgi:hypothetical protein
MTNDWAASTTFTAINSEGARRSIEVCIGVPRRASPTEWTCAVSITGLVPRDTQISGADALQSLGLACAFASRTLVAVEERGGRLECGDGDLVQLSAYFPSVQSSASGPSNER